MHNQQHPDSELLDQLRAGLLDDQPARKVELEQHLANCDSCHAQSRIWQQLNPDALGPKLDGDLTDDLQAIRNQALNQTPQGLNRPLVPYATAALLVLAVTAGLWTLTPGIDSSQPMTAQSTHTVPDIYEDLEFYLWLAEQKDGNMDNTNPNNT